MSRPLNREKGKTRTLVLHSATKLFIEKGYTNTRIKDIADDSGVGYNEIFRMFIDKDNLLSQLVNLVIEHQFEMSIKYLNDQASDELLLYIFECVLQLYICEINDNIREMYAVSYSMPNTSQKIYDYITKKLENVFHKYLPEYETKDFYELEIAAAGIMRGFIINPCNMYFTIDRKVNRFIKTLLKVFEVPKEEVEGIIKKIEKFKMKEYSIEVINTLYEYISNRT